MTQVMFEAINTPTMHKTCRLGVASYINITQMLAFSEPTKHVKLKEKVNSKLIISYFTKISKKYYKTSRI